MNRLLHNSIIVFLLVATFGFITPEKSLAVSKGGRTAAEFLSLNLGARSSSMGGAFTSIASGADAVYWNPSGIIQSNKGEIIVSHISLFQDINLEYGAGVVKVNKDLSLSAFIIYLGYGTIEGYDISGERTDDLTAYDMALGFGGAYIVNDKISVGTNLKYINEKLDQISGNAFAVDFGIKYTEQKYSIAAVVRNFGTKIKFENVEERLPLSASLGITGKFFENQMLSSIEFERRAYGNSFIKSGLEYNFNDKYFIRTGYNLNLDVEDRTSNSGLNFGLGSKFNNALVDYSISLKEKYSSDVLHQFSFKYLFE